MADGLAPVIDELLGSMIFKPLLYNPTLILVMLEKGSVDDAHASSHWLVAAPP